MSPFSRPLSKWTLLAVLFVSLVLADQVTKFLAVDRLTTVFEHGGEPALGEKIARFYEYRHLERLATDPHYVFRPVWRMNYVENPGAAWGMFRELSLGFRNLFFGLISIGAVIFIVAYYRKLDERQRYLQIALALVLAGAVGNFLDRVARGYVIDFIEWYWWNRVDLRWPTFNIADSLIVVGVAMLLVHPGPKKDAAVSPERRREGEAVSGGSQR
jgi:signal peptidase II